MFRKLVQKIIKPQLVSVFKKLSWKTILRVLIISIGVTLGIVLVRQTTPKVSKSIDEQINEAVKLHRYGEAYYLLKKAVEKDPYNTKYYLMQVELLKSKGRVDDAINILNTALSKNGEQIVIYEALCPLYKLKNEFVKEIECLEKVVGMSIASNNPLSNNYRYDLAKVYIKIGRFEEAKDQLSSIINSNDRTQEVFFLAARDLALWEIENQQTRDLLLSLASEGGNQIKADVEKIMDFVKNADEARNSGNITWEAKYYGWLAGAQLTYDLCPLSHRLFEKSIEVGDKFGIYRDAHKNYGVCLYNEGLYDKALEQINLAIQSDPIDLESWIYKANICNAMGNFECADEAYSKVFTVGTNNLEWYKNYCQYLENRQQVERLQYCLDDLYKLSTREEDKKLVASEAAKHLRNYDVDASLAEKWLNRVDQNGLDFLIFRGWIKLKEGRDDDALSDFLSALSIDPYNASAAYYIAVISKNKGDRLLAKEWATKAIDYDLDGDITNRAEELLRVLNAVI